MLDKMLILGKTYSFSKQVIYQSSIELLTCFVYTSTVITVGKDFPNLNIRASLVPRLQLFWVKGPKGSPVPADGWRIPGPLKELDESIRQGAYLLALKKIVVT